MFRLTRMVSYRGTEAQLNSTLHQGNWQPPHKTKNETRPIHGSTNIQKYKWTKKSRPHPTPTESSKSRRTMDISSFAHATHLTQLKIA